MRQSLLREASPAFERWPTFSVRGKAEDSHRKSGWVPDEELAESFTFLAMRALLGQPDTGV